MFKKVLKFDIAVVGASLGGTMAALSAAKCGKRVFLSEECEWIGGQLTSQGVPPDEHKWIESFGCTTTYSAFREKVRSFYKTHFPLSEQAMQTKNWNIGNSSVSRLAHEPLVAHHLLREMLLPYLCNGQIILHTQTKPIACHLNENTIECVVVKSMINAVETTIFAQQFIDATETGELLPLSGAEYVTGAESKAQTDEPHASDVAMPQDMQPVTWVAAVEYCEGENHTIEKPALYDDFATMCQPYDQYPVLSWYGPDSSTGKAKKFGMFDSCDEGAFPLWSYRRIVYPAFFKDGFRKGDVVFINWPQNDYFMGNVFDSENDEENRYKAKQLTLSFVYWLQTNGYAGIRLCPEVMGTSDGLAQYPYIRESRRIKALFTVKEQDVNAECRDEPVVYSDSVGVGCYHIDFHITTQSHTFAFFPSWPYEIPLGALLPIRITNLIAGCKNIGTTHLTNGCFRLHPTEWNIGEAAGYLAAFALDRGVENRDIWHDKALQSEYQKLLTNSGVQLHWDKSKITKI